jgi:hypothetical protein
MQLGELTLEVVKPLEGTTFEVSLPDGKTTTMKLEQALAYEVQQRRPRRAPRRIPFSLFFLGDASLLLPQGMYSFRSEALTLESLFIVPLDHSEEGTEYEAVFT